ERSHPHSRTPVAAKRRRYASTRSIAWGSAISMKCSHCGVENPLGMRFCGACGGLLEDGSAVIVASDAQRRHLTVMVCDLVESTPLAGSLHPRGLLPDPHARHAA